MARLRLGFPAAVCGLLGAAAIALSAGCGGKNNGIARSTGAVAPATVVRLASPTPGPIATSTPRPATTSATAATFVATPGPPITQSPAPSTPAVATAVVTVTAAATVVAPVATQPTTLPRPRLTPPTGAGDRCHTSQLSPSFVQADGAAGHTFETFRLTNQSAAACTLYGFVGMQMLDARGRPLPTKVVRNGGMFSNQPGPSAFVLPAGAAATFMIVWTDVLVGNETSCPAAAQLEITPPDETDFLLLPVDRFGLAPCGGGTIDVTPVRPPG